MTIRNRIPKKRNIHSRTTPYNKQQGYGLSEDLTKLVIGKARGRARFQGENHATQILPDGRVRLGEYIGPGTEIEKRIGLLNSGNTEVRPITKTDEISMIHDIDYVLSQNAKSKAEQLAMVRKADLDMLKRLKKIKKKKLDNPANILLGERAIGAKVQIEKRGKTGATLAGLALGGPVGALVGRIIGSKAKSTFQDIAGPLVKRDNNETNALLKAKRDMTKKLESQGVGSGLLEQMKNMTF